VLHRLSQHLKRRSAGKGLAGISVRVASSRHFRHAASISRALRREGDKGAQGVARRTARLLREKMAAGDAVIALDGEKWVGFCYVSPWEGGKFVSTSALIVRPAYRGRGIAKRLKIAALKQCRKRYPRARPFGLSTSPKVVRINEELGFVPVSYGELTRDPEFWKGCESCPFHGTLMARRGRSCRCVAMLLVER